MPEAGKLSLTTICNWLILVPLYHLNFVVRGYNSKWILIWWGNDLLTRGRVCQEQHFAEVMTRMKLQGSQMHVLLGI